VRDRDLARGPGRLCAALGLDRALSGIDLTAGQVLWFESMSGRPADVVVSTRIGLSRDQHRRLRFLERGSTYVSVPP
jgi:DNA-3-methyladenine glycosylase